MDTILSACGKITDDFISVYDNKPLTDLRFTEYITQFAATNIVICITLVQTLVNYMTREKSKNSETRTWIKPVKLKL